jgi:hypothetical protein
MALVWGVAWAGFGLLVGVASKLLPFLPWDVVFRTFDAPLPALGMPGFIGGFLFSFVLAIASRNKRFEELSIPRFLILGGIGGLLVALVPATMVLVGMATLRPGLSVWQLLGMFAPPCILLGAVSAAGTLAIAKRAERADPVEHAELSA